MGEVWLAQDTLLDRRVAVKFLAGLSAPEQRAQFIVEARAAARLSHPNVLTVFRVGEVGGQPFIVSEFIEGTSLDQVALPLPWRQVLDIALGIARGLAAAHERGVLHRDIKPANVVLARDGSVKIVDFGLAELSEVANRDNLGVGDEDAEPQPGSGPRERVSRAPQRMSGEMWRALTSEPVELATTLRALSSDEDAGTQRESRVMGTPHYMAPELWCNEPATAPSDVYATGALLFELCAGTTPHTGASLHALREAIVFSDAPPLEKLAPGADPRFAAIVDRCLRRDPAERFTSAAELCEALERVLRKPLALALPEGNPYRGLCAFEAEHRALFFGRTAEIESLVARLRVEPFVLVAGDSGVGKSSLCRAGVLPLVMDGALGDGRRWFVVKFVPGERPLAALLAALQPLLGARGEETFDVLREEPGALGRMLRVRLGPERGLLLFVDQLEELSTMSDPKEAALLAEVLGHLAKPVPGVRLLMAVRSDCLARVAVLPVLGDAVENALIVLRPLAPARIRDAILGPAEATGISLEPALLAALANEAARTAGGLPLLQFALAELWEARPRGSDRITLAELSSIGGVAGALARHADAALLQLLPEQRASARRMLLALTTPEGRRARLREKDLLAGDPSARAALDALVRGRLLVCRDAAGEGPVVEIAHEALIEGWSTLRSWVEAQAEGRAVRQRLSASADEWERLGRSREVLWSARQMKETAALSGIELTERERAFLQASRSAARERELGRVARWASFPLLLALLHGGHRFEEHRARARQVEAQQTEARVAVEAARARSADADAQRKAAFAAFDEGRNDEGEARFLSARAAEAEADRAFGKASQALTTALELAPDAADVRNALSEVLAERVLAAEREGNRALAEELLERLSTLDVKGERLGQLRAPAKLAVETWPAGARVTVAPYVRDANAARTLGPARGLGNTPVAGASLEQGSYLVVIEREGRVTVRYPLRAGRGEELRIGLDLHPESAMPPGFAYIPPGSFLFGSADDDVVRRSFLAAPPQHVARTGEYLIARHETTFGDWIAYLRARPADTHAQRGPEAGMGALSGAIRLEALPDGAYQLTLQPTSERYVVKEGEMLVYRGRSGRTQQDWLRMPVAGITFDEAVAYTRWLDSSGRVRGARLCTEQEWERAARGADERLYPHGDTLAADDANTYETYGTGLLGMGPDEVGTHPASQSPFGVDDMAGNVFEWVTSSPRANIPIVRGGAYFYDAITARANNRTTPDGGFQDPRLGLRVCASLSLP
jgi:formylglycine-generating enzyme required for sulfatase activity